ncbi:MAG: RHS repeat-associated core domain-containing protein [Candidatus Thermoplasmatota archaeon]|nr:RHS repeat-associated core domain-containing protein [Candidatus Thermoplasmatota archaeon]
MDGDTAGTSGFWAGSSSSLATNPATFTLELGAVKTVSRVKLYKVQGYLADYTTKNAEVQVRNGGVWSTVGTLSGNTQDSPEIVLANATGDAIKVLVQGVQSGNLVLIAEAALSFDGGAQTVALQRFDAWGNKTQSAGASIPQYGYTGREPDATGLIYYRARYYDPSIGRFISRDPIGLQGGLNQYAYVSNDPVNATDPSGEIVVNAAGAAVGAGYGAVSGGISGAIVGWNAPTASGGFLARSQNALIGFGAGIVTGGIVGGAAGFVLNPALAASAPITVASGVAGGLMSNLGTTTARQLMNQQPVHPLANLNWQQGGIILTSAAGGAAGVATARLLTGLASSTTAFVGGESLAMPGSLAEAVAGGLGAGYAESSVSSSSPLSLNPAGSFGSSNNMQVLGIVTPGWSTAGKQSLPAMADPLPPASSCFACATNSTSYASSVVFKPPK